MFNIIIDTINKNSTLCQKLRPDTGGYQADPIAKGNREKAEPEKKPYDGKVMLVEDVPFNLQILKMGLDKNKVQYDTAEDGAIAVDLFQKGIYYAIFMDLFMPNMNGYDATTKIREIEKDRNDGKTVFICGLSAEEDDGSFNYYNRNN